MSDLENISWEGTIEPRADPVHGLPRECETVKVGWYCGLGRGWEWTNNGYEPSECGAQFETVETREDWESESCAATCPECGGELSQSTIAQSS